LGVVLAIDRGCGEGCVAHHLNSPFRWAFFAETTRQTHFSTIQHQPNHTQASLLLAARAAALAAAAPHCSRQGAAAAAAASVAAPTSPGAVLPPPPTPPQRPRPQPFATAASAADPRGASSNGIPGDGAPGAFSGRLTAQFRAAATIGELRRLLLRFRASMGPAHAAEAMHALQRVAAAAQRAQRRHAQQQERRRRRDEQQRRRVAGAPAAAGAPGGGPRSSSAASAADDSSPDERQQQQQEQQQQQQQQPSSDHQEPPGGADTIGPMQLAAGAALGELGNALWLFCRQGRLLPRDAALVLHAWGCLRWWHADPGLLAAVRGAAVGQGPWGERPTGPPFGGCTGRDLALALFGLARTGALDAATVLAAGPRVRELLRAGGLDAGEVADMAWALARACRTTLAPPGAAAAAGGAASGGAAAASGAAAAAAASESPSSSSPAQAIEMGRAPVAEEQQQQQQQLPEQLPPHRRPFQRGGVVSGSKLAGAAAAEATASRAAATAFPPAPLVPWFPDAPPSPGVRAPTAESLGLPAHARVVVSARHQRYLTGRPTAHAGGRSSFPAAVSAAIEAAGGLPAPPLPSAATPARPLPLSAIPSTAAPPLPPHGVYPAGQQQRLQQQAAAAAAAYGGGGGSDPSSAASAATEQQQQQEQQRRAAPPAPSSPEELRRAAVACAHDALRELAAWMARRASLPPHEAARLRHVSPAHAAAAASEGAWATSMGEGAGDDAELYAEEDDDEAREPAGGRRGRSGAGGGGSSEGGESGGDDLLEDALLLAADGAGGSAGGSDPHHHHRDSHNDDDDPLCYDFEQELDEDGAGGPGGDGVVGRRPAASAATAAARTRRLPRDAHRHAAAVLSALDAAGAWPPSGPAEATRVALARAAAAWALDDAR